MAVMLEVARTTNAGEAMEEVPLSLKKQKHSGGGYRWIEENPGST